jgi:putative cell wall-binding protein
VVTRRLAAVSLLTAALAIAPTAARAEPSVQRLAGATRYDTAAAVAGYLHAGAQDTVVLATGTGFADALSAGVAAAALDAPLLLVAPGNIPEDELRWFAPASVVLVGGTAAIPQSVEDEIEAITGAAVDRVAGANRFETADAVAMAATPNPTHVFTASGTSFQTALVAATHAAREGGRLALSDTIAEDVVTVDSETVDGTPAAINRELLEQFPTSSPIGVVTTIDAFPDALSATVLAAALDAPVLFTGSSSAGVANLDVFDLLDPDSLLVVGGTAAVPDAVLQQLFGWLPLPPSVDESAEAAIARDVFARLNDERAERFVPPLVWDEGLAAEAAAWAEEMSATGYRHADLPPGQGENIHHPIPYCADDVCHLPTSGVLHRDWMHSGGHRDNILEPGYAIVGIGVHCGADGTLWAVERFGMGFGDLSSGATAPTPIVHDTTSGTSCSGDVVGEQPWWEPADS